MFLLEKIECTMSRILVKDAGDEMKRKLIHLCAG